MTVEELIKELEPFDRKAKVEMKMWDYDAETFIQCEVTRVVHDRGALLEGE